MAANMSSTVGILKHPAMTGFRALFYAVTPAESSFAEVEDVPNYVNQAMPGFFFCIVLENTILALTQRRILRLNDAMSSIIQGLLSLLPLLVLRNIELTAYAYVYQHWRLVTLPWDNPWTWVLAFVGVDLGYYWLHRLSHEVNFMWAAHQVHHSSEDYNLSTALRQSVLQKYNGWIFYIPMAFGVPPSMFLVHSQFNLLYQFWIHTEAVGNLGPLEYILNTPSHHRVHHGRNRYCIDKNYAGTLIIWDRMFGTFAPESDTVVYGLVHPLSSWDAVYIQLCHWKYMIETAFKLDGFSNKVSVFLKGPGWEPGKPRMGLIEDIPDIQAPQPKFDKDIPSLMHLYTYTHLLLVVIGHHVITDVKDGLNPLTVLFFTLFLLWTLTDIGFIYEHRSYAGFMEVLRCAVYLAVDTYYCAGHSSICPDSLYIPRCAFLFSASIWLVNFVRVFDGKSVEKME